MVSREQISEVDKIRGKTIKSWSIHEDELDLTFSDNTKVYNLLHNPKWIEVDEHGYPKKIETEEESIQYISAEKAALMLPDGEYVHTFRQTGFCMLGCDRTKTNIIDLMKKHEKTLQLSGKIATGTKHGLVLHDETSWLFIQTKGANL